MCGILGIASVRGRRPSLSGDAVNSLSERLSHRGPDGQGVWEHENIVLAHRRLAVIDPSPEAGQPMSVADTAAQQPRFVITYNGELYNDAQIRAELSARGVVFRTRSDTETVLHGYATWGTAVFERLRGIFALGIYDRQLHTLTLARDALGVKPLYFFVGLRELMFSSEIPPLLEHPDALHAPNPRMMSAYLTTIRTTLGHETLYQGVYSLQPGQMLQCDLERSGEGPPQIRLVDWWRGPRASGDECALEEATHRIRECVRRSIIRQLRADVPVGALLSGGLDSTIVAAVASRALPGLQTFAAGVRTSAELSENSPRDDLWWARYAASEFGLEHREAILTRERFSENWAWMVRRMRVPLSTPNETAIYEVARLLRENGCVVALSGEGADELFGGYDQPLELAIDYLARRSAGQESMSPAQFELRAHAWVPPDFKHGVLSAAAWRAAEQDRWLEQTYEDEFAWAEAETGAVGIDAHLRFHRRINLTGLLQRLDSATMLAGVEGRTPFADLDVAELAESLPMSLKFQLISAAADEPLSSALGVSVAQTRRAPARTKIVLREAFSDIVPRVILERPKASFPLPFQEWLPDQADVLRRSGFAAEFFSESAIEAVSSQPSRLWRLAWPMINLTLWGESAF